MKNKIERLLYGDHWFFVHFVISVLFAAIIFALTKLIGIKYDEWLKLINVDTISLSASIAGFVFAGMSIFISMEGSKKMATIKAIGKANIIYCILICSIAFFVISLLLMLLDINVLCFTPNQITLVQIIVKHIIEWLSLYTFLLGFIYFFSSIKLIYWIFI